MGRPFRIDGARELIRQLRKAQDQVLEDLADTVDETAKAAISQARRTAPEDSGELAASGFRDPVTIDKAEHVASAVIGFRRDRAAFIHEARKGGKPIRFLRKATNRQKRRFKAALLSDAQASLARIFKEK